MSEKINMDSTNLSIPVDAFEQFEANSMYEEEEYITLSDIVSPDPTAPQLPNDIGEIPYDNEVVLGVNDDPNTESLPSLPAKIETEQTESTEVNASENNEDTNQLAESIVTTEQPAEQISDNNSQARPKRIRKQKSYVDDFIDPDDRYNQPKSASTTSNTKPRRGRKPKQNLAQIETTQSENGHDVSLEQLPKPTKRGRKKMSNLPATEPSNITNSSENIQETPDNQSTETNDQNPASETPDSNATNGNTQVKRRKRRSNIVNQEALKETPNENKTAPRRKGKMRQTYIEENLDLEQPIDSANNSAGELISDSSLLDSTPKQTSSKKGTGRGRRGRQKKTQIEDQESQIVNSNETQQRPIDRAPEGMDNSGTTVKKTGRRGRKKKAVLEETMESSDKCITSYAEEEDDMDNVSLQALCKKNGDNDLKTDDQDTSVQTNNNSENPQPNESDEIDVGDDISLSQLKETFDVANTEVQDMELDETVDTLNSSDVKNDTEACKIDNQIKEEITETENDSLLQEQVVEDETGRPKRRKARKVMHYDEGSDEDPFANVELSDDEHTGKKGRYYSDDEYVPGSENKKGKALACITSEDSDISEIDEDVGEFQKGKRKLFSSNKGPRGKKGRKSISDPTDVNVTTIAPKAIDEVDDIEVCLQSSVIQANENSTKKSVYTNEFENFIAQKIQGTNLQIKKVSSEQSSQNAPLEIPVLDPDAKKNAEVSVQTTIVKTTSSGVQTSTQHETPMKDNIPLSAEQSEQACEFLKSIVKTTSELGQLMTEKSEDFITKKINTKHVTDTFKMDYCVKKSFLLLKLAKHNIVQMEDDLSKQYEEFLKRTNLISYREVEKTIKPKPKEKDSDSDCEIVEDAQSSSSVNTKQNKPKFNPKTVFLNKELSIKIAKKPPTKTVADKCKDTLNIKNKHSVWISDTVMVKKVKPTQSFLAQDSRNKKPPDCCVTEKMVSDFFDTYYKQMAPSICAPFTTTSWIGASENYVCNYFIVQPDKISEPSTSFHEVGEIQLESNINDVITGNNIDETKSVSEMIETANPASLNTLCTEVLKRHMNFVDKEDHKSNLNQIQSPRTLFRLCLNAMSGANNSHQNIFINTSNFSSGELVHDNLKQISETLDDDSEKGVTVLEEKEDMMDKVDSGKGVKVHEEKENIMDETDSGKLVTVPEEKEDMIYENDSGKGVTVLEEQEDVMDEVDSEKGVTVLEEKEDMIDEIDSRKGVTGLEEKEEIMNEIDSGKVVTVLEEKEDTMNEIDSGKVVTVFEEKPDMMDEVDLEKGVNVLEEKEDMMDNMHFSEDDTLFDVESSSIQDDVTKTYDTLRKTCSNVKETKVLFDDKPMPTLHTLCFQKIELLLNPEDTEKGLLENDENMSENSFTLSENDSLDLSISDCKIDDMIAELDSIVKNEVKSLLSLCVEKIQRSQENYQKGHIVDNQENALLEPECPVDDISEKTYIAKTSPNILKSLKHLSFVTIKKFIFDNFDYHQDVPQYTDVINTTLQNKVRVFSVKKLANICFEIISANIANHPEDADDFEKAAIGMTINCVNTVSEEAFHNMEEENMEDNDDGSFYEDDNYESEFNTLEGQDEDNNWESQVQLQEFKPCLETPKQTSESQMTEDSNLENENCNSVEEEPVVARIKLEPVDEPTEAIIDSTIVKTEPLQHDEMTIIPESIRTKQECIEETDERDGQDRLTLTRQNSSSFDVDSFEEFVRRNKMMHPLDEPDDQTCNDSGQRIRRQHEPDMINEYDPLLNLLVPQTFEPSSVVNAKGVLMASSSDDESSNQKTKKKVDRKGRGRPKRNDNKQQSKDAVPSKQNQEITNLKNNKEPPTAKGKVPPPPPVNEVAILTRRMREKIRQEEKKVESSDSESETGPVTRKKDKELKENEKLKSSKSKEKHDKPPEDEKLKASKSKEKHDKPPEDEKLKASKSKEKQDKPPDDEIQCSNVDSTEQIEQNDECDQNFTGFSTVDQNDINSYQKYVKFVYDKILPKHTESTEQGTSQSKEDTNIILPCTSNEIEDDDRSNSPLINYDEPTEMLECEPTMPIFDDDFQSSKQRKKSKPKSKTVQDKEATKGEKSIIETAPDVNTVKYTERNGWWCYPIDPNETKLYQNSGIILEKLPESFVQTYFEYQEIAYTQDEDKEVDRLINLNTLKRSSMKEAQKIKGRNRITKDGQSDKTTDSARAATPTSDGCAELTASEDEGANVDDEEPPPVPLRHANENCLAKDSLMNDSDSDDTKAKIKEELDDGTNEGPKPKSKKTLKGKPAKESQPPVKLEHPESLMLTADKMMNKELNLLHAPVVLNNEVSEKADKGPSPKNKSRRSLRGHSSRDNTKNEEDSSSEEEKQWVSTKEKLLKRMGKREDTTLADDAKRAKLVTEFIERRGGQPEVRKRAGRGPGRKRSARKRLEREKQMRVLSHELFGAPVDPNLMGTRHAQFSQSYFKGRRNIRKVIDKKSLARSTVIANMEEFERKCRLNQRQAQLRELLGCEEGVNVLVINDEVCLEYGFEEQCPLVSVHPFFTKVMKAHQYEGVKFMWDACFETLEKVESGHPGGGCILAHCMGLGKTLQVLALLHTVLTHPRVGMQRVLVCCPLSTVLNWVDEIHKWIGPVTDQIKVFELSKLKKTYERAYQLEDWYSGGGIFIIGYELFRSLTTLDPELDDIRPTIVNKIRTALLDPGPDIIVCDEGHLLKNDCSVLAVAMSRVATKRRIVLTGTPMQNNLREYYCMVNFVKPNLLGTYSEYSNRFENPIMNGQHRDSQEEDIKLMKQRTHILHKVLEGCLQRQEASVLYPYLPKKHEYTVFISLTKVQWDLYKHYVNNCSSKNNKQSVLKDFHILQKIWSHPQVLHNFQTKRRDEAEAKAIKPEKLEDDLAHEDLTSEVLKGEETSPADVWWLQYLDGGSMLDSLECSNKFVVVFKILDECIALGDKVLIFSTSLFTMDALEYFLKKINKWSLGQEYYRLDGSVPAEVRQKWCREFNAEHNLKTKLFLISTRAGSLGLNMVAANRVIILDTSWNPAHDIQSIFRVYRFGQKKDCYIYRLVALGTMEQKIYERSVTKQAVACRVVDEQQIDRHYNMAELTELYRYDEMGLSVSGGVAVGVTDVALLRVARHPALHAVHEHDSLLRGSSEQQLPEHERNAAWMQFQQEHAHKQMQNQLVSSFSLHLPTPNSAPSLQTYQQLINDPTLQLPIKTEHNLLVPYQPQPPPPDQKKGKRGRKKVVVDVPVPVKDEPRQEDKDAIQEEMSRKIMNILLRNNFQNQQEPRAIAHLVSTVRKIVAYGYVPKGSFNNEIAMQIADVLLMKDPKPAAPTATVTQEPSLLEPQKSRRGRPRKGQQVEVHEPPVEVQPSTSKAAPKVYTPGRRRAAIDAEYSLKEAINEGDEEGEGNRDQGDEDWQNDDSGTEEIVPEAKPQKKTAPPVTIKTEPNKTVNESDSILLSDDDEPGYIAPIKQKAETTTTKKTKAKESQEEVIPLHPSLLDNKNFIKIVAHTYLEGNPMLDEDAATLAAQYSTLKAKKEVEATGKLITNGPIYDIAIKVLGIDILKKLHNANPTVNTKLKPKTSETVQVKSEPTEEAKKPVESKKPGPRLKARGIGELTGNRASPSPAPASHVPSKPVVPVGLINRSGDITPNVTPVAPVPQFVPEPEESILPDDDDVIVSEHKPQLKSIFKKSAKPLILNSMMAAKAVPPNEPNPAQPKIPKLVISAGKLLPAKGFTALPSKFIGAPAPAPAAPAPPAGNDTICLDSDEETITSEPTPKPKKRVALKSTAKPHSPAPAAPPVPAPAPAAAPAPVPVCLTAANGQFNNFNQQITDTQLQAMLSAQQAPYTNQYGYSQVPQPHVQGGAITLDSQQPGQLAFSNGKYVVVPASNITRLPPGVVPANAGLLRPAVSQPYSMPQTSYQNMTPQMSYQNVTPQMTYQNLTPQMTYQNVTPQMSYQPQPMPNVSQTPLLQNTMLQPLMARPQYRTVAPAQPAASSAAPESILPTTNNPASTPNKTVCKPGDILRITKTGQIEVLNRGGEKDVSIVTEPSTSNPAPAPSQAPEPRRTRGRAAAARNMEPPKPAPPVQPAPPAKPAQPTKAPQPTNTPEKTSERSRKLSVSSSSGSDSSRPSTPEAPEDPDDPLAIFQNVVHIKAPEDDSPRVSKPKPTMVGNTSITSSKSSGPVVISKSQTKPTSKPTTPAKATQDDIMKHISKTDTILKKLDKTLAPTPGKTPATNTQKKPAITMKTKPSSPLTTVDTIDLDDYVPPPKPAKPTPGPSKVTSVTKNTAVKPAPAKPGPSKPSTQTKPAPAKPVGNKIVGKSKDIIISVTGKSSTLTTANSGAKARVATVEKLASTAPSASKKRPATTDTPQPKKRPAPMTLKDFNIDDIDDIIELE